MLPPSRQARARATRQLSSEQSRSRAWLGAAVACAVLGIASLFVLPPLAIVLTALTALSASRWRRHHRAVRTLSRRRPTPTHANGTHNRNGTRPPR